MQVALSLLEKKRNASEIIPRQFISHNERLSISTPWATFNIFLLPKIRAQRLRHQNRRVSSFLFPYIVHFIGWSSSLEAVSEVGNVRTAVSPNPEVTPLLDTSLCLPDERCYVKVAMLANPPRSSWWDRDSLVGDGNPNSLNISVRSFSMATQ